MGLLFLGVAFKRYSGYPTSHLQKTEDRIARREEGGHLSLDDNSYTFPFAFWPWEVV